MPVVKIMPNGIEYVFSGKVLLSDALNFSGVLVHLPCGGKGICKKCSVIVSGKITALDGKPRESYLEKVQSCNTYALGDTTIFYEDKSTVSKIVNLPANLERVGVAVDIGTTTVQMTVVDIKENKKYVLPSFLNPQRSMGHDVISRISAAEDEKGYSKIVTLIRERIEKEIKLIIGSMNAPSRLEAISIAGNTSMTYFFCGIPVSSLGKFPYLTPKRVFDIPVENILPDLNKDIKLSIMPVASAFIGGDIIGGMSLSEILGYKDSVFFMDIGTNGEIFIRNKEKIFATSCAMGPALEGMNMSCGMTATAGAIIHSTMNNDSFALQTVNNEEPVGIAGTGMIDIMADLLRTGVVDDTGKIIGTGVAIISRNGENCVKIHDDIMITQKDIRNLQLAKGAALAASEILLSKSGVSKKNIKKVLISGSFGENLNLDNFLKLKFLPEFENAEYHFLGNTSLMGAEQVIIRKDFYEFSIEMSKKIITIDLSSDLSFNEVFLNSLNF